MHEEVAAMVKDIQLMDKKDTQASKLSGGMKRKLRYSLYVTGLFSAKTWDILYRPILPPILVGEIFYLLVVFCPVLMIASIEDMATFTALVKIYSTEYFSNTKVPGLGEILV